MEIIRAKCGDREVFYSSVESFEKRNTRAVCKRKLDKATNDTGLYIMPGTPFFIEQEIILSTVRLYS